MFKKICAPTFIFILAFTVTNPAHALSTGWLPPTDDLSAWDDFNVFPANYTDKYRAVDDDAPNCNDTDVVWTGPNNINDKQAFYVDITSVPVGSEITGVTVRPCMATTLSYGSSTIGVRINLDGQFSGWENYFVTGDVPTILPVAEFLAASGTPGITKATTTELVVGFKYLSGQGAVISDFEVDLEYQLP